MECPDLSTAASVKKLSSLEFIEIVNDSLNDYYGNLRHYFCSDSSPTLWIRESTLQENGQNSTVPNIAQLLIKSYLWEQSLDCLNGVLDLDFPTYDVLQKIFDAMMVVDSGPLVTTCQQYVEKVILRSIKNPDSSEFYFNVFKEEEIGNRRMTYVRETSGSFANVLHLLDTELEKFDQKKRNSDSCIVSIMNEDREIETEKEDIFEEKAGPLQFHDVNELTGRNIKNWWREASNENRIDRLVIVLSLILDCLEVDLFKWLKRSKQSQKHPFSRPVISRLIWPYEEHGNPYAVIIKMVLSMYSVSYRNELFDCITLLGKLVSYIAMVLPTSLLDKGDGYPTDSHQRRVFAQCIANTLEDSGMSDDALEVAVSNLNPSWLKLMVSSRINNFRSNRFCGDLPPNLTQQLQMIVRNLSWNDYGEHDDDSIEDMPGTFSTQKVKGAKRNSKGETQLHVLSRAGNSSKLSNALTKYGQLINLPDHAGWTPLHEAATHGNLECVQILLDYQPIKNSHSMSIRSKSSGSKIGIEEAKSKKPLVNLHAKGGDMGLTALHEAVIQNRVHVADLLLDYGGYKLLNDTTNAGLTPLDLASDERMVAVLLKHKRESWQDENKWISEMDSSINQVIQPSINCSYINLSVLLLHAYIESTCLLDISQRLKNNRKGKEKKTRNVMVQNVDYIEYSHDLKALRVFLKYAKCRLTGKVTIPEASLIAFIS